jgi:hypothetical protein
MRRGCIEFCHRESTRLQQSQEITIIFLPHELLDEISDELAEKDTAFMSA